MVAVSQGWGRKCSGQTTTELTLTAQNSVLKTRCQGPGRGTCPASLRPGFCHPPQKQNQANEQTARPGFTAPSWRSTEQAMDSAPPAPTGLPLKGRRL